MITVEGDCERVETSAAIQRLRFRTTALPRHGTDIGPYLLNKIFKDFGIEKEK